MLLLSHFTCFTLHPIFFLVCFCSLFYLHCSLYLLFSHVPIAHSDFIFFFFLSHLHLPPPCPHHFVIYNIPSFPSFYSVFPPYSPLHLFQNSIPHRKEATPPTAFQTYECKHLRMYFQITVVFYRSLIRKLNTE